MKYEEAISAIKDYGLDFNAVPKSAKTERQFRTALKLAIECIEKQIPKKPIVEVEGSVEFGGCYGVYYCPSCYECEGNKKWKRRIIYDQDYCDVCGQAIDWSEVEE